MKLCIYCGKVATAKDNQGQPTCDNEWICEGLEEPSIEEELGKDPTGRNWRPENDYTR